MACDLVGRNRELRSLSRFLTLHPPSVGERNNSRSQETYVELCDKLDCGVIPRLLRFVGGDLCRMALDRGPNPVHPIVTT